jgi:hypothetical protein
MVAIGRAERVRARPEAEGNGGRHVTAGTVAEMVAIPTSHAGWLSLPVSSAQMKRPSAARASTTARPDSSSRRPARFVC